MVEMGNLGSVELKLLSREEPLDILIFVAEEKRVSLYIVEPGQRTH